jgi:hypothetical protein
VEQVLAEITVKLAEISPSTVERLLQKVAKAEQALAEGVTAALAELSISLAEQ